MPGSRAPRSSPDVGFPRWGQLLVGRAELAAGIGSRYIRGLEPVNPSLPERTEESVRLGKLDGAGTFVRFSKQVAKLKATVMRPGFTGEKENKPQPNKPHQTSSIPPNCTTCPCE